MLPGRWPDLLRQFSLFAGAYLLYRLVEGLLPARTWTASAFHHASQVISFERTLHIFVEPGIQAWAAHSHLLLVIAAYVYLNAQTTLIVGALLYLYIAHNRNYYFVRNMLRRGDVHCAALLRRSTRPRRRGWCRSGASSTPTNYVTGFTGGT